MIKKAFLILVSIALVVYLLRQTDVREVFRVISAFPPAYLLAGFAAFIAGHLVRAYRFKVLLGEKAPLGGLFSIIAVQTAAVGFLPLRAGEFSLMYLLKKEHGVEYPVGAAVLVLSKALDFLIVVSLFFISFSALPVVPGFYRSLLPWAGALFFMTAASLLLLGRSREIYARLPGFFREGPLAESALMANVKKVFRGAEVIRSKKTLLSSLGVTVVLWALLYGSNFFVLWGVGLKFTPLEMVFITTSMSLFANLPIHSPGGFGTLESFWTLLLVALGTSRADAIATGFASHIVTIVFSLVFMLYGLRLIKGNKGPAS
ncbi:MAG TPA: lysylphosphatidylglycerol synthase transmembrane domain-containing protein [Nitrospirota bacterium]|nr:lysylphosphatidylglycerol synthase transmembrane domain-containing protein [Nitrospirota bacterium]